MSEITVTIKVSTGATHTATLNTEDDVAEVKRKLQAVTDIPADQQRLIYAGHVLKDPQKLAEYKIKEGHTVHLVRGAPRAGSAAPAQAAAAPPQQQQQQAPPPAGGGGGGFNPFAAMGGGGGGGMGNMAQMQQQMMQNPEMMAAMMDNPLIQNMLNDPDQLRNLMMMNPQTRAMMEANPEFAAVLQNPQVMREAMAAMRNPALMQEMQRNNDRAMANIEANPQGFNALRRMYQDVQEPLQDAAANAPAPAAGQQPAAPADGPLPNPWGAAGGGGAGGAAAAGGAQPDANPFASLFGGGAPAGGGAGAGGMPDMAAMMQNPAVQQMTQQMMANPELMGNLMQGMGGMQGGGGMGGLGGGGGGSNLLSVAAQQRLAHVRNQPAVQAAIRALEQAILDAPAPAAPAPAPAAAAPGGGGNPFAALFAAAPPGGAAPAAAAPQDLRVRYADQLGQLNAMGFTDPDRNLRALTACGGNVQAALEMLLGGN